MYMTVYWYVTLYVLWNFDFQNQKTLSLLLFFVFKDAKSCRDGAIIFGLADKSAGTAGL